MADADDESFLYGGEENNEAEQEQVQDDVSNIIMPV